MGSDPGRLLVTATRKHQLIGTGTQKNLLSELVPAHIPEVSCQPPNQQNPRQSNQSAWRTSSTQPAILDTEIKPEKPRPTAGAFPVNL